jgi:hypothetical protein
MKFFLKLLVLSSLMFAQSFLSADLNFITRFFLSNKGYAKNIDVKVYILTEAQSAALLADPYKEPVQMLASELSKFDTKYLVVRVKNLGNTHAWGTLACSVPRIWDPVKIPILNIVDEHFSNYLICIEGAAVAMAHEDFPPKLTFEWDALYTK